MACLVSRLLQWKASPEASERCVPPEPSSDLPYHAAVYAALFRVGCQLGCLGIAVDAMSHRALWQAGFHEAINDSTDLNSL